MALAAQIKRLTKHSAIYGVGGFIQRALAVLLLPLYLKYLSTERLRDDRDPRRPLDDHLHAPPLGDPELVLPLLLRRRRFRLQGAHRPHGVLVDDGHRNGRAHRRPDLCGADLARALRHRRLREPRSRDLPRALGDDELRPADGALPRRGALGAVLAREPRERPAHDRSDDPARRRLRAGADRRHRRQLQRDARRVGGAPGVPALPARPRVRPRALPPHARVRLAVRALGSRPRRHRLQRPVLPREDERDLRSGHLRARRPHRRRARVLPLGVPARVACLRVLDQGRR